MVAPCTWKTLEGIPCPPSIAHAQPTINLEALSSSCTAQASKQGPYTQPSEPIYFPKLQIYVADFPYLLGSCGPEAANLGDLVQFWVRPRICAHLYISFSRTGGSTSKTHLRLQGYLPTTDPHLQAMRFQG